MRRTFLIWLLLFVCAAFAVTGGMAYWQFSKQARQQAEQLMVTRLNDMLELVDYSMTSLERLRRNNDDMALTRARALAEIVRLNPAALTDQEVLQGLCNDLGAEEVAITDEKGIIRAAVPASSRGLSLISDKEGDALRPCIDTPGYECVQRANEQLQSTGLQYVGVHRQDSNGIIRMGFRPMYEQQARNATSYGRLAANHRLGTTGRIVGFRGGTPLNREALPGPAADFLTLPTGQLQRLEFNGMPHFVYALERSGFRLVGIVPLREFYPTGLRNLRSRLISNSIVLATFFCLVSFLLHFLVTSRLASVNETLRRITEGEVDARVDVGSSPEFVRLSTGINTMLDAFKSMNDAGRERIRNELELARSMQQNALPNSFPAFPERNDFDIHATLIPSASMGGDFYDFALTDTDHLSFMVACVSGTGVPAALFMMRSLSIIRSFARSESEPATILSAANRVLCEGRTANMHLSVFYGRLELSSGTLTCVSAGHEPPLLQHLGGRRYAPLQLETSPVLGAAEGVTFRSNRLQLEPGDRLLLYTPGLPHACNAAKERFGMARLLETLEAEALTLQDLPNLIRMALRRFTEGDAQEQDITMLAIEYQSIMRHGGQVSVQACESTAVRKLLQESLEAVLAAPVDIAAMQAAAVSIMTFLPPDTPVTAILGCNEKHAELTFTLPPDCVNPLLHMELMDIDSSSFRPHTDGNHLILSKTLA